MLSLLLPRCHYTKYVEGAVPRAVTVNMMLHDNREASTRLEVWLFPRVHCMDLKLSMGPRNSLLTSIQLITLQSKLVLVTMS